VFAEESVCSSVEPQNFYVFAVGSFEPILRNKLLRLTIFKRFKALDVFANKRCNHGKSKENLFFL